MFSRKRNKTLFLLLLLPCFSIKPSYLSDKTIDTIKRGTSPEVTAYINTAPGLKPLEDAIDNSSLLDLLLKRNMSTPCFELIKRCNPFDPRLMKSLHEAEEATKTLGDNKGKRNKKSLLTRLLAAIKKKQKKVLDQASNTKDQTAELKTYYTLIKNYGGEVETVNNIRKKRGKQHLTEQEIQEILSPETPINRKNTKRSARPKRKASKHLQNDEIKRPRSGKKGNPDLMSVWLNHQNYSLEELIKQLSIEDQKEMWPTARILKISPESMGIKAPQGINNEKYELCANMSHLRESCLATLRYNITINNIICLVEEKGTEKAKESELARIKLVLDARYAKNCTKTIMETIRRKLNEKKMRPKKEGETEEARARRWKAAGFSGRNPSSSGKK